MKPRRTDPFLERRYLPPVELRAVTGQDGKRKIRGYAAVFDKPSEDLGGFVEYVRRGAFAKSIGDADVRALIDHNPTLILGRNKSGTLQLVEDETGLYCEIDPPDTSYARDLDVTMTRGDVDGMSFGFRIVKDRWTEDASTGIVTRELIELHVFDVSVVTYPAYPDTSVALRSLEEHRSHGFDATTPAPPQEPRRLALGQARRMLEVLELEAS